MLIVITPSFNELKISWWKSNKTMNPRLEAFFFFKKAVWNNFLNNPIEEFEFSMQSSKVIRTVMNLKIHYEWKSWYQFCTIKFNSWSILFRSWCMYINKVHCILSHNNFHIYDLILNPLNSHNILFPFTIGNETKTICSFTFHVY